MIKSVITLLVLLLAITTAQRQIPLNTIVSITVTENGNAYFYIAIPANTRVITTASLNQTYSNLIAVFVGENSVSADEFDDQMGQTTSGYNLELVIQPSNRNRLMYFLPQFQGENLAPSSFEFKSSSSVVIPIDADFGDMTITLDAANLFTYYLYTPTCNSGSYELRMQSGNTIQSGLSFRDFTDKSISPQVGKEISLSFSDVRTNQIYLRVKNLDTCTPGLDCSPVEVSFTEKCGRGISTGAVVGAIVGSILGGLLLVCVFSTILLIGLVCCGVVSKPAFLKTRGYQSKVPDVPTIVIKTEGLEDDLYSIGHKAFSDV